MGIILFIELEREVPNLKEELGGKAWARVAERLDKIATGLGLPTISDLTSADAEEMAELMADTPGFDVADFEEEWYDPAEGLRVVGGLLDHLRSSPKALKKLAEGEDMVEGRWVLEDLEEAVKILHAAEEEGVRFHFGWAY
jgi:hypothetical protein